MATLLASPSLIFFFINTGKYNLSDKITRSFYGFDNIFPQFFSKPRNVHFKRNRIKIEFRFTKPPGSLQNFQFCFWKAFVSR